VRAAAAGGASDGESVLYTFGPGGSAGKAASANGNGAGANGSGAARPAAPADPAAAAAAAVADAAAAVDRAATGAAAAAGEFADSAAAAAQRAAADAAAAAHRAATDAAAAAGGLADAAAAAVSDAAGAAAAAAADAAAAAPPLQWPQAPQPQQQPQQAPQPPRGGPASHLSVPDAKLALLERVAGLNRCAVALPPPPAWRPPGPQPPPARPHGLSRQRCPLPPPSRRHPPPSRARSGALATPADKAAIEDLVLALEASPWRAAAPGGDASPWLDGRWELLYASTEAFRNSPFFAAFSNVVSGLVADDGTAADAIFAFTVRVRGGGGGGLGFVPGITPP
jgi:hypothetical protein